MTTYVSRIRRKYERVGRVAASRIDLYRLAVEDGVLQARDAYGVLQVRDAYADHLRRRVELRTQWRP